MQRVRKQITESIPPVDDRIRWQNKGTGKFYLNGKVIKPGEVFLALPWEVPQAFRSTIVQLDPEKVPEVPSAVPLKFELRHYGGPLFNVVSEQGKVINEKPMSKEDALDLIKILEE